MARSAKRTPKQQYIIQILVGASFVVLAGGAGWGMKYVTHLPEQQITSVVVEGGDTINAVVLQNLVTEELEGAYIGLIPRSNKYLYPEHDMYRVLTNYPRVKDAAIRREDQTLLVHFSEYAPYALWCDETLDHCLLVDHQGFAFAEAPQMHGGVLYRFVVEDTLLLLRSHMLSETILERTVAFAGSLKAQFGFEVSTITHTTAEDVYYVLQEGGEFRTTLRMDDTETLENLASILGSEEFAHVEADNFNYIDLRFGNKVYVNEEIATATSTVATTSGDSLIESDEHRGESGNGQDADGEEQLTEE